MATKTMEPFKNKNNQIEVEFAECDCCGLTEECTPAYIARVREKFEGRWLCGLCSEAVKDERIRSSSPEDIITINEALVRHMKFCEQFKSSSPPVNPTEDLIAAMRHLILRSLDSPRKNNNGSSSFVRSKTCFSRFSDGES
ncbi:Arginine--tRNA ligase [Gossypium australe]|uniref:Arginine--tRNA ligase n=1 Tax=Gossypium australe TaxID=47621 RepID=A0A5B6WWA3_9ROSI|nr:Arginine--tRNA ligase [Gossypium australe]